MYLAEQVRREGPKKYILGETKIRTPKLIAYGMEDDLGLGPFVITEFIKGKTLDKFVERNPFSVKPTLRLAQRNKAAYSFRNSTIKTSLLIGFFLFFSFTLLNRSVSAAIAKAESPLYISLTAATNWLRQAA
jgi:hypothetical protein